jgi:uncharacterized protein (TIGR02145 family)
VLTTVPVSNITYNSAVSGGNITLDGGTAIMARGVCWSTTSNPTLNDSKTTDGTGTGSFVSNITGLLPNTTYHVRSYATNSSVTGYGNDTSFTTLCEFYPPVSVSIEASTNPVCEGSIVSLQATPTNGGLFPVYQWKVNSASVGTSNSVLMYSPANNDTIQCILTSSLPCTSTPAISNTIVITVNPMLAVGVTIVASANNVCQGDTVTFTATGANAGTISNYQWKLGGNVITGATNSTYSYVPANNDVITCVFTSNPSCTLINSATSNSIAMTVISPPGIPTTGTHVPSQTQIIWNWNSIPGATGYKWNTVNDSTTAMNLGSATSKTETGLTCNTSYNRYVWASNTCGISAHVTLSASTSACSTFICGQNLTVNHIAGTVAPVNKTTSYGTVTNVPGEPSKCWITSNLGSDHQAAAKNDSTEASAGWYWQFNRKQGYKHGGSIPIPTWSSNAYPENSNWEPSNDPCNITFGDNWRIPTKTEWDNIDLAGAWNNWNGPWNSSLKIHAAGAIESGTPQGALLFRGSGGMYWSSSYFDLYDGWVLAINSSSCYIGDNAKTNGYSVRCIKNCDLPLTPTQGNHTPSPNQIIWNWNPVSGVTGYKWNTTNNYTTATDMGTVTIKTETGLTCNTTYTRYVWAYNSCGNSTAVSLNQTTSACVVPCPGTLTVSYGGQTYNTVQIGSQCWLKENLNIGIMINGILDLTNDSVIEKYCYNNDNSNCAIYGGLYPWWEMMQYEINPGAQGICPSGWHIPSDAEWCTLTQLLNSTSNCVGNVLSGPNVGGKMKTTGTLESGTGLWYFPNTGAINETGFSAHPSGSRDFYGAFNDIGYHGYFWSSSFTGTGNYFARNMFYNDDRMGKISMGADNGYSVRCIRDF